MVCQVFTKIPIRRLHPLRQWFQELNIIFIYANYEWTVINVWLLSGAISQIGVSTDQRRPESEEKIGDESVQVPGACTGLTTVTSHTADRILFFFRTTIFRLVNLQDKTNWDDFQSIPTHNWTRFQFSWKGSVNSINYIPYIILY